MENKEDFFPQDTYTDHLTIITGINFTRREIDIMACLFNARGTSKIASFLSIAPKTVINHIRNIMLKVECNSREGIIDFIERSNKASLVRRHYSHLVINAEFGKKLKEISKLIKGEGPSLTISSLDGIHFSKKFIGFFETHLKLIGCAVSVKTRPKDVPLARFLAQHHEGYMVYVLSNTEEKELSVSSPVKRDNNFILHKQTHLENILFILFEKMPLYSFSGEVIQVKYADLSKELSYYCAFFEIIQKAFPYINLQRMSSEFIEQYEHTKSSVEEKSFQGEIGIKNIKEKSIPLLGKNRTFLMHWNTYLFIAGFIVIGLSILGIGYLSFSPYGQEEIKEPSDTIKEETIRSDLPIPSDATLLNRSEFIAQLNEEFQNQKGIQTAALVGIGGAGKTTLARQYAHAQKANVIWEINAETTERLYGSFEKLAHSLAKTDKDQKLLRGLLELNNATEKKEQLIAFVKELLKLRSPWFLIFDNIENFSDIQKCFPRDTETWGEGKVILTTRNINIRNSHFINHVISIGELTLKQKQELFRKIMGQEKSYTHESGEILAFLEHIPPFPLDVSVAAYYLKSTNIPYTQYLEYLADYTKETNELQENILKEIGDYTKTRYAIIIHSLKHLMKKNKEFADLLLFISLLDSQNVPKSLLDQYKNPSIIDSFIYHLIKHSWLTAEVSSPSIGPTYSMHRSTQSIILNFFRANTSLEKEKISHIANVLEAYIGKTIDEEDFSKIKSLVGHANAFLSHYDFLTDRIKGAITGKRGAMYFHLGEYTDAQKSLEEALAVLNNKYTTDSDRVGEVLGYLGSVYKDTGNYEKAKTLLNESLSIHKNKIRKNAPLVSWALINLGDVYRSLGNYEKARELYTETLATQVAFYGNNHPKIAWSLACLANIYMQLGNYKRAKNLMDKSFAIYKKNFPKEHLGRAWVSVYVGGMYNILSQPENAKEVLKEALAAYLKHYGKNHIKTAWCYWHVGHTCALLRRTRDAKAILEHALEIYRQHYGENHYRFAAVSLRLGTVYREIGDYKKSKTLIQKCLDIYNKHYKKDHIEIARVLRELAQVYILEGNLKVGEDLSLKALEVSRQNKSPEEFIPLEILAEAFLKRSQMSIHEIKDDPENNKEKAKNCLKKALKIVKVHFPADSPHMHRIQATMNRLAQEK